MKFLLDENFPCSSADFIESCGHMALRFNDVCGYGSDDETVFAAAGSQIALELLRFRKEVCASA